MVMVPNMQGLQQKPTQHTAGSFSGASFMLVLKVFPRCARGSLSMGPSSKKQMHMVGALLRRARLHRHPVPCTCDLEKAEN